MLSHANLNAKFMSRISLNILKTTYFTSIGNRRGSLITPNTTKLLKIMLINYS